MSKNKRYSITLDLYINAGNDRDAMLQAARLAEKLRRDEDNEAQVVSVDYTPFASLHSRRVHTGRLTIFQNKLIET